MSKNITIKQNGSAKNFNAVSIIKTNNMDSGSAEWVPEDEQTSAIKKITLNGNYVAAVKDGVRGYRAVFINVPAKSVTGRDPVTGVLYEVTKDNDGNLIFTVVEDQ